MRKIIVLALIGLIACSSNTFSIEETKEKEAAQTFNKKDVAKIIVSLSFSAFCFYSIFAMPHFIAWKRSKFNNGKPLPKKLWPSQPIYLMMKMLHQSIRAQKIHTPAIYAMYSIAGWVSGKYGAANIYNLIKSLKAKNSKN